MGSVLSQLQIAEIGLSALSGEAVVPEATNAPDLEEKLINCKLFRFFSSASGTKGGPHLPRAGDIFSC